MDQHRFDDLVRRLAGEAGDRRRLLRAILGGTGSGLLALLGPSDEADARQEDEKKRRRRRRRNKRRRNPTGPPIAPVPASDPRCPVAKPANGDAFCEFNDASSATFCAGTVGSGPLGFCFEAPNGSRQCVDPFGAPCVASDCTRDADCPADHACVEHGACCGAASLTVCMPKMPATP